jgi:hypothetical protein
VVRGTRITIELPSIPWYDSYERDLVEENKEEFLALAEGYAWLNPHLSLKVSWNGETKIDVKASNPTWDKWLPSWPTSPHWYDISRFRRYMAAHMAHRPNTTVREFVGELRGLSSTAKQKVILEEIGASHVSLHDYFGRTKANRDNIAKLLTALKSPGLGPPARSSPVSTGRPGSTIRSGNLAAAVTAWTPSWRIFAPTPRSRSSWCCIWRAHASVIPTAASRPSWSKVK